MYVLALFSGLRAQFARFADSDERGDVPGWVMITVMTAALVVALLAVAAPKLTDAFSRAISSISG
jgi:Tfp pilus assembly protein PilX